MQNPFTIRVYGIRINDRNEILLSDERLGDFCFTKFPGGGMEFGEGTRECLIREWKEELDTDIEVLDHLYTTDFFQPSAFHPDKQIMSIYYFVRPLHEETYPVSEIPMNFTQQGYEEVLCRWKAMDQFSAEDVTLPIDKIVADILCKR